MPIKEPKTTKKSVAKEEKKEDRELKKPVQKKAKVSVVKKNAKEITPVLPNIKKERYYEAIGRRKTAVARVRLFTKGDKLFLVNNKPADAYFASAELSGVATSSLDKMKSRDRFRIEAKVSGGGLSGQAEAIRHGTARVLVKFNLDYQKRLRRAGYLTRDSRMKERKKFGLKRARRAPQWAKR